MNYDHLFNHFTKPYEKIKHFLLFENVDSFEKKEEKSMNTTAFILAGYIPMLILLVTLVLIIYHKEKQKHYSIYEHQKDYPLLLDKLKKSSVLEEAEMEIHNPKEYDFENLKSRICSLLEREKLYLNPDIRVTEIAERLCTNKTYVAQAIKLKLNKNFCQLIHYYRVKEAMDIYSTNPEMSMKELARSVGFNSMTTFNTAFSRTCGSTPAEWCRDYRTKHQDEF